jgi:hypothetical protein
MFMDGNECVLLPVKGLLLTHAGVRVVTLRR